MRGVNEGKEGGRRGARAADQKIAQRSASPQSTAHRPRSSVTVSQPLEPQRNFFDSRDLDEEGSHDHWTASLGPRSPLDWGHPCIFAAVQAGRQARSCIVDSLTISRKESIMAGAAHRRMVHADEGPGGPPIAWRRRRLATWYALAHRCLAKLP